MKEDGGDISVGRGPDGDDEAFQFSRLKKGRRPDEDKFLQFHCRSVGLSVFRMQHYLDKKEQNYVVVPLQFAMKRYVANL